MPSNEFAIGEDHPEVASCPACGRPLEATIGRCPGCGTPLLLGVQAGRAGLFTAVGAMAGLLLGALAMGLATGAARPPSAVAVTGGQADARPTASPGSASGRSTIPSLATSALRQASVLNGRLVDSLGQLQDELAATRFDAVATAQTLRALAADAAFGDQVTPGLAKWAAASELSRDLASFYNSIRATAREGLASSLTNPAAYRAAATEMVAVFGDLPALDAVAQRLAAEAGISIQSVGLPIAPTDAPAGTPAGSPAASAAP